MSATLQDHGMFSSRKRRKDDVRTAADAAKKVRIPHEARDVALPSRPKKSSRKAAGAMAPLPDGGKYVQEAIHKEVHYTRLGRDNKQQVSRSTMEVFKFVEQAFDIPDNFEKNHKFGPLSGVSHELRVVSAYMSGLLKAKKAQDATVKMCMECGKKGHFPRRCPAAFDQ